MSPTSPRFRIRDSEGREIEIPSVEDLADRILAGEVGVETPLFDAGTGQWNPAGTVSVFQFVVEELRAEGRLESKGFPASGTEADPAEGGPGEPAEDPVGSPPVGLPMTPDPFELHLPLRSNIPGSEESPEDGNAGVAEESASDPPPEWTEDLLPGELLSGLNEGLDLVGEVEEESGGDDPTDPEVLGLETEGITWGLPLPARTPDLVQPDSESGEDLAFSDTTPGGAEEDAPPPFPLERDRSSRRPHHPRRERPDREADEDASDSWGSSSPTLDAGRHPTETSGDDPPKAAPRPEAVRPVRSQRDRRVLVAFGVTGILLLLLASVILLFSDEGSAPMDTSPGSAVEEAEEELTGLMAVVPPPPGLEPFTDQLIRGLSSELGRWTDSLRMEAGLASGPPSGWLGGFYLSHAGNFPEVPEFWQQYRDFLGDLRDLDREGYREAVLRVVEQGGLPQVEPGEVSRYFEERYAVLGPLRDDRYAQLIRVSEVAEELHHFLAEAQDQIAHAPAVGQGISPDPILEAVPLDEETRSRLDQFLDSLFQALDRSRGGGAPSFEGLRDELYSRFGHPV